jgi:peptidoglycan/xylan/chitin deacetylase (PgdA/CDA1 family)
MDVISKILAALHDAHLPPTYGFMNGVRVEEQPADAAVLQAWRSSGDPLGNHSWSHMNLNQHSLEEFEKDISQNEPMLGQQMKDEDWHWFRFPYLAEGDTPEKRAGIRTFLGQHGYKVAAVTMSFGDYLWNEPYARCKAKGDTAAMATLESSYLGAADANINYYGAMSHALFNRDIPYVLLMHVGAFDAEMLPKLLDLYRSRGFEYISLPDAERDIVYREDTDLSLPPDADTMEGMMSARHLPLPARTFSLPQFDAMCR